MMMLMLATRAQEQEFMVFTQSGEKGIVPTMVRISQDWHQIVQDKQTTRTPLRMLMMAGLSK